MTNHAAALQLVSRAIDSYSLHESDAVIPVKVLIDELITIERRAPGADVTVRAMRDCLYAIQDQLIVEATRRSN